MTDKNGILAEIEDGLGSEGSRELAIEMFDVLKENGFVTFDGCNGFQLADSLDDRTWLDLLNVAIERTAQ